jgi:hypothetical protein
MTLLEGYKRIDRLPTKSVCVDRGREVVKVGKISAFAFEHREEAEFERKFKVAGELGFKVSEELAAKVKTKIESDSGASLRRTHSKVTLILDATSVAEQTRPTEIGITGDFCSRNHGGGAAGGGTAGGAGAGAAAVPPRNMAEFLDRCGDAYLERQEFGGHYTLTWDLTTLTETERKSLKGALNLEFGDYTIGTDVQTMLNAVTTVTSQTVTWESDGLPPPASLGSSLSPIDPSSGRLIVGRFIGYLADLDRRWGNNASSGIVNDQHNGVPISQKFQTYSYTDVFNCNSDLQVFYDPNLTNGFSCRDELAGQAVAVLAPGTPLQSRLALRQSYLSPSPGLAPLLRWPKDEAANQALMRSWIDRVVECRDVFWPAQWKACNDAFRAQADAAEAGSAEDWSVACDACKIPNTCLYGQLYSTNVAEPSVITVEEPAYTFGAVSQNGSGQIDLNQFDTHLCTLSGVYGALRGGQEFVFLEGGNAHYQLIAQSGRTDPYEEVGGTSVCIDRSRFYNAYAQDFYGPPTQALSFTDFDIIGPTTAGPAMNPAGQHGSFIALAGIGGRFENLSTTTFISDQPTRSASGSLDFRITNALPNQYLKARVMSDGLRLRPGRTAQQFSDREVSIETPAPAPVWDGVFSTSQARVGDSQSEFCFLTSVSGEFRTSEDSVSLRVDGSSWVLRWSASMPFLAPVRTKFASARCVKYDQR